MRGLLLGEWDPSAEIRGALNRRQIHLVGTMAGAGVAVDMRSAAGMIGEGRGWEGGRREIAGMSLNVVASVSAIVVKMGVNIDTGVSMKIVARKIMGNGKRGIIVNIILENVVEGILLHTHMVTVRVRNILKIIGNRRVPESTRVMGARLTRSVTSIDILMPVIYLIIKRDIAALAIILARTLNATATRLVITLAKILTARARTTTRTSTRELVLTVFITMNTNMVVLVAFRRGTVVTIVARWSSRHLRALRGTLT
jgi:hypothetical protein